MKNMTIKKTYTLLLLFAFTAVFAQQKPVQASIDSVKIKIGSQFNLTIKATADTAARVNFPEGKNFGLLEVLESYPVDTVRKGALYELVKKYGLTQFDSGRYVIPSLPVVINNQSYKTDSLTIEVAPVAVDTVKQQLFDIKPVIEAESGSSRWWVYIGIALAVIAAGLGIWWYIRKRKRQPKAEAIVYATPIQKAAAQLKKLESKHLLEKGEIKDYYSELTDIARIYIEEAIHIPAMESTTTELIEAMRVAVLKRKMKLSAETFEQLEKVLRTADMVKFAKSRPLDFEIAEDRSRIENSIVVIDKSIPEEEVDEEAMADELRRAEILKKKRRKKIYIAAGVIGFILLLVGVFVTGRYIRDNYIGRPTKELLEGEWVQSEYGNPPVKIETPAVLKRYRDEKIQDNLPPNVASFQKFVYGQLGSGLNIIVTTSSFKEATQMDAAKGINDELAFYEKMAGAKNIITKTDDYSNDNGLNGKRAYGTMTITNPLNNEEEKVFYTIMLFTQPASAQEIIVIHKDGDIDAEKITERIINSVELSKAAQP